MGTVSCFSKMLFIGIVEEAGSTDYDAVSQALRTNDVDTPLGKIRFDDRSDVIGFGWSVYQVRNEVFVELR